MHWLSYLRGLLADCLAPFTSEGGVGKYGRADFALEIKVSREV